MSKLMNDVLGDIKGEDKIHSTVTGKGSFSKSNFGDLVSAISNDTTFNIKTYDKNGQESGTVNVSELIRSDLKKTLDKAKYPQKSEVDKLDSTEICTAGLSQAIPVIVEEWIRCGKKFDLPTQPDFQGSIYLTEQEGKTRTVNVRNPETQEFLGTTEITTQDHVEVRAKSGTPDYLQTKIRKDPSGNLIDK
mgnify:CR=1 FL=1